MIVIALGSNRTGKWGPPDRTLAVALKKLVRMGVKILAVSSLYETVGVVPSGRPGVFANAVAIVASGRSPDALIALLKWLEKEAGQRSAMPSGPRPLDLDLIDWHGLVRHAPASSATGRRSGLPLVLPHPRLRSRPFVLAPLAEIAPGWRHPVTRETAQVLWRKIRRQRPGRVLARRPMPPYD
ncbi:MAG: 2-amino-4-hydroxy-6-hydroxymethyldihydropteridine diphosphokinase, partial [Pseudomonadota bacterium]|nr:2-amino-4-hydroxy-6-hydroxymethyldihydropteridine diphosphokinase [Pseudomonadota bacterium]